MRATLTLLGRLFQLLANVFPALGRMHEYALRVSSFSNQKVRVHFLSSPKSVNLHHGLFR